MSIRSFGLALLAACALASAPALADEVMDVRLSSLSMEGEHGEKLTVSRKSERLVQLRLEDSFGVWSLPAGALDIAFMPDIAATQFSRYDQRYKRGYRVVFTGQFVEGNRRRRGQLAFEFLEGRLIAREIWEVNDSGGFDFSKSEPF